MITKRRLMQLRRLSIVGAKYAVAVILSLQVALWASIPDFLSVTFIAVITLQPSVRRGFDYSWIQVKGTILGAIVTLAVVLPTAAGLHPQYWPYQAAGAMGITIIACLLLGLDEGTVIGTFTVSYLTCLPMMIPDQTFLNTLHLRITTIGVGLLTGMLLNYFTSLFGHYDRLYLLITEHAQQLGDVFDRLSDDIQERKRLESETLREHLDRVEGLRRDLEDFEHDLMNVTGASDPSEVSTNGSYNPYFQLLYPLKDINHHLRTIILQQLNDRVSESELASLSNYFGPLAASYDQLLKTFLSDGSTAPASDLNQQLKQIENNLRKDESSGERLVILEVLDLVDQLSEAIKSFETFARSV